MNDLRIHRHPIGGAAYRDLPEVTIYVEGRAYIVREGESLAAALWASGIVVLGRDPASGAPRGLYCGIGQCQECRVQVDGCDNVRACLTPVREGMQVSLVGSDLGDIRE